jgi:peroxiredoxin
MTNRLQQNSLLKEAFALLTVAVLLAGLPAVADNLSDAQSLVGTQAPQFTLRDANGKTRSLAECKGKYVVLEWTNFGCPFVKAQYESKIMQTLQAEYTAKGVEWLTISSSAPGKQGYFAGRDLKDKLSEEGLKSTAYLTDPDGTVGRLYKAKTTPDMFVINPQGKIVYAGAIDDNPTTDASEVRSSHNYLKATLDEAMSGKPLHDTATKSYGCSVKYGN